MQSAWFFLLVSSICLEGLGRKYLPEIPAFAFYFLKDVVLLFGWYRFRPGPDVRKVTRHLYRGFGAILGLCFIFTIMQIFNPEQESQLLGLIGLRAYWLWWIAPGIIATVFNNPRQKQRAIYVLLFMSIGISAFAIVQFASPPTAAVNLYSVVDGEAVYADMAIVGATGKVRVASTFSFLTGFVAFTILVPAVLLSIGIEAKTRSLRRLAGAATLIAAAVLPMSGSRSSLLLGAGVLAVAMWGAGLFFTRVGRRVLIGAVAAGILSVVAFPEAFLGVQSRFDASSDETSARFRDVATILPPVAIAVLDYPVMGIGTGMQQNARASFRINPKWVGELEHARYLIELGIVGFVLVWLVKLGLMVALLRAYRILKRAGRRGSAGAALSYAALTMFGSLAFDHVWQALFFLGCGFVLAEVVTAVRASVPETAPVAGSDIGPAKAAA